MLLGNCPMCGKEIEIIRATKYCSKECSKEARKVRRSPKYIRNCLFCRKEFVTSRSDQVYCTKGCKKKVSYRRNREQAQATIHRHYLNNKTLYIQRAKGWKSTHKEQVAKSVYKKHDKDRFGGNREIVLDRDYYTCQHCGGNKNIIVHHRDETGQSANINNDLSNLLTLCKRCHLVVHRSNSKLCNN